MLGNQSQVNVEGFIALGQRQHEVAAGQWPLSLRLLGAGVQLLDQLFAVQHIQIEVRQVGGEHAQHLFVLAGGQPEAQP